MRARWRVLVALVGATALAAMLPVLRSAAVSGSSKRPQPSPKVLEVYGGSPVLVRAGERVRIPVRAVCATAGGQPCRTSVTLGTRTGIGGPWSLTTSPAMPTLQFDLSAPAARAAARGGSAVSFFVQAAGPGGAEVSLAPGGRSAPAQFFVAKDIPVVGAPAIPFGRVRAGTTALSLPWGSGPARAGLAPGRESATLGPSSFDVDARGRIHLADAMQDRVAVFSSRGRLLREIPIAIGARADIALTDGGALFAMDQAGSDVVVRRVDAGGHVSPALSLGPAIQGQIRTLGEEAVADLLPQDQWVGVVADDSGSLAGSGTTSGRPVHDAQLLRVVTQDYLRLGTVSGDRVVDPIEVRFAQPLGEIALAEPDGSGGYWAVVHVWRWDPSPADQFQVVHVVGRKIADSFATGDSRFADTPPLGRFRLGRDGSLYQLVTESDGMRIVRYRLGGGS